jgi:hypothetical protein
MKFLSALACFSLILVLTACGGTVHVGGFINTGASSASGTVSLVHLSVVSDSNGTSVQVTAVTLVQIGGAQTFTFCGSHAGQFPMNSIVKASFNPGTPCFTLVAVEAKG